MGFGGWGGTVEEAERVRGKERAEGVEGRPGREKGLKGWPWSSDHRAESGGVL